MSQNKVSRRDAIKLLGAALGGVALSNIPSKWSKPALAASQLPQHAQQSVAAGCWVADSSVSIVNGFPSWRINTFNGAPLNTPIHFTITITGSGTIGGGQGPFTGVVIKTDPNQPATAVVNGLVALLEGDRIDVLWEWDLGSTCYILNYGP